MTQSIDESNPSPSEVPFETPVATDAPPVQSHTSEESLSVESAVYADAVEADSQSTACGPLPLGKRPPANPPPRASGARVPPHLRAKPPRKPKVKTPRAPAAPLPTEGLPLIDRLLRTPGGFVERIELEPTERLAWIAKVLMIALLGGGAIFGAAMGAFRPGPQIASAAIKLPLVLLLTAALSVPALSASLAAAGNKNSFLRDAVLVLSSLSLTALALSALAPVVLLAVVLGASYHSTILTVVACCGVAGASGLLLFLSALWKRKQQGCFQAALVGLTVFALVGSQLAWTFRPFVARPRAEFQVVRSLEGSFMDSVTGSMKSAAGIYHRDEAPLPPRTQP